jgi:hypothetical protein
MEEPEGAAAAVALATGFVFEARGIGRIVPGRWGCGGANGFFGGGVGMGRSSVAEGDVSGSLTVRQTMRHAWETTSPVEKMRVL